MVKRMKLREADIFSKKGKVKSNYCVNFDTKSVIENKTELPFSGISRETTWWEKSCLGKRKAETDLTLGDWGLESEMDVPSSLINGFPRVYSVLENGRIGRGQRITPHRNVGIKCTTKSVQHKKKNPFVSIATTNIDEHSIQEKQSEYRKRKHCRLYHGTSGNNAEDWMADETTGIRKKKYKRSNESYDFDRDDTTTTNYDTSSIPIPPLQDVPSSSFACLPALQSSGDVNPPRAPCQPLGRKGGPRRVSFASLVKVREHELRIGDPRLCQRLSREKKAVCKVLPVELGNEVKREYFIPTLLGRKQKKFRGKRRARRVLTSDEQMERLEANGVDSMDVLKALGECFGGWSQVKRAPDGDDQSAENFVFSEGRANYKESCRKARKNYLEARCVGEKVTGSSWKQEAIMHSFHQIRCGVTTAQQKAVFRAERQQKLLDMEK